jgi:Tol biopolymer transport system component/predicted Ser/Thr protein kinase
MPLEPGTTLGPYRIEEPIGAGGMGEVYRARDTRLDRDVAVKILSSHLSGNPELRQRFEREAKTISSLQHPHICSLFDIGHEEGVDFLVMEHIEGQNLSKLLAQGSMPLNDVLKYGQQITEALEAAHKAGVVHRDLKPGNVMITRSGVKLLDFGLAKVAASGAAATDSSLTSLPTVQPGSEPLTTQGTILGTYQYMSPEQLEGQEADVRSDIFALGAVLYEMATGKRAFEGQSQASLIAAIMSSEPAPISTIQSMTPPALDRVVKTCLEKDPEDRWQTAHDVALQLKWIAEGGSQVGLPKSVASRRHRRERTAWIAAGAFGLAAAALAVVFLLTRPQPEAPRVLRYQVPVPPGIGLDASPKISPDGKYIAYLAADSTGTTRIWVQRMDALEPASLPGTEDAQRPFWSPDSRFLAYFNNSGKLKKVSVSGAPPQTIGEAPGGADGSWGNNDVILFDMTATDSLQSIPAGGGVPVPAAFIDRSRGETGNAWPYFLPDGKRFLFLAFGSVNQETVLKGAILGSKESKVIGKVDSRFEYVPPGYLLFVREGTLLAQPFDANAMEFTGDPVPLAEEVSYGGANFQARFSGSQNGILTYWRSAESDQYRFVWVDRTGREIEPLGPTASYGPGFSLSFDGARLAMSQEDERSGNSDVWTIDLRRGTTSRFTFEEPDDGSPVWSPSGDRIVYSSNVGEGGRSLFIKQSSGAGKTEPFYDSPGVDFVSDWSRDGRWILVVSFNSGTRLDLSAVNADGSGEVVSIASTEFHEHHGQFSPDGAWVAYSSLESGQWEVYVQAFPEASGKWQISTRGGASPRWSEDGNTLYYLSSSLEVMAVDLTTEATLQAGVPRPMFRANVSLTAFDSDRYEVTADGERFLLLAPKTESEQEPITVVVNWVEELKAR